MSPWNQADDRMSYSGVSMTDTPEVPMGMGQGAESRFSSDPMNMDLGDGPLQRQVGDKPSSPLLAALLPRCPFSLPRCNYFLPHAVKAAPG